MARFLVFLSALFYGTGAWAQKGTNDSLFVTIKDERAMVIHEVRQEENLYSIAQQYTVPALVLSQNNDVAFYDKLEPKRKLLIPLGSYNYLKVKPSGTAIAKAIYYKPTAKDSYAKLGRYLDVPEEIIRGWNNGAGINPDKALAIGWLIYASPQQSATVVKELPAINSNNYTVKKIESKDTAKSVTSDLELVYNYQTSNGTLLDSMSGMVVFFKPQTTVNNKLLYAFSNELAKGRVIKVVNPSNQQFIFAKVIGPLPATKQYINAKIGLDGRARAELDTREVKLWCNLFFK